MALHGPGGFPEQEKRDDRKGQQPLTGEVTVASPVTRTELARANPGAYLDEKINPTRAGRTDGVFHSELVN